MEKMKRELPVYLYSPNLVGYARLLLLSYGLCVASFSPLIAAYCFIGNLVLDALDGYLARLLNQVSAFGAILDYTIDRISLASYAILLGTVYPHYMLWFVLALNLDLVSHLFHLKASAGKSSHKEMAHSEPWILRIYYKRFFLGLSCLLHDLFFIFLFIYSAFPSQALKIGLFITFVGVVFKTLVHTMQIMRASIHLLNSQKNTLN